MSAVERTTFEGASKAWLDCCGVVVSVNVGGRTDEVQRHGSVLGSGIMPGIPGGGPCEGPVGSPGAAWGGGGCIGVSAAPQGSQI